MSDLMTPEVIMLTVKNPQDEVAATGSYIEERRMKEVWFNSARKSQVVRGSFW